MKQNSPEWLEYRLKKNNASEAGAVMNCNPWQPKNVSELYDLKKGDLVIEVNQAMQRGTDLEPQARAAAEEILNTQFTPAVRERGRYSASMDGLDFDERIALEIKCPMSEKSKLWNLNTPTDVKKNAPNYWWQMVHQHYVVGFQVVYFLIWSPDLHHFVEISSDDLAADRDELLEAWESFNKYQDANERPELFEIRTDEDFQTKVREYLNAKKLFDETKEHMDNMKAALLEGIEVDTKGFGIEVKKVTRKGNVNYKKIPELNSVDLERYRNKSTSYWSIK